MTDKYSKLCDLIKAQDVDGLKNAFLYHSNEYGKVETIRGIVPPISLAVSRNGPKSDEVLEILLNNVGDINSDNVLYPFLKAIISQKLEKVKVFLKFGIDVNRELAFCQLPLTCALEGKNEEIVRLLKEAGADDKKKNSRGISAYDYAKKINKRRIRWYLTKLFNDSNNMNALKKGELDLSNIDANGKTLLMRHIEEGDLKAIESLLLLGWDVLKKNINGTDAYNYCMRLGKKACAEVIKKHVRTQIINKGKFVEVSAEDYFPIQIQGRCVSLKRNKTNTILEIHQSTGKGQKIASQNNQKVMDLNLKGEQKQK